MVETVLPCDCGFEARADDEEGLVAAVRRHALEVHGMALSHDDALRVAARARTKKPHPEDKEEA
jgi:predicted small metal-binding protein